MKTAKTEQLNMFETTVSYQFHADDLMSRRVIQLMWICENMAPLFPSPRMYFSADLNVLGRSTWLLKYLFSAAAPQLSC